MSKPICLTPEYIEEIKREFALAMEKAKVTDGRITFTRTLKGQTEKAKLRFTELAWTKMLALVMEFDKEVAWHGVAERGEDNSYTVSDILVYPQEVGAATVEMDTEAYAKWIQDGVLSGDERYDKLRFQGHSHVNMATSPSSVDMQHQEEILNFLRQDGFYIFVIWNKRNEHSIRIYDLAKNTLFENADITLEVIEEENGIEAFLKQARTLVKTKTYTPTVHSPAAGSSVVDYRRFQGGYRAESGYPITPPSASAAGKTGKEKSSKPGKASPASGKSGKGKGKGKIAQKSRVIADAMPAQQSLAKRYYDDDEDPTSPFYVRDYWRD